MIDIKNFSYSYDSNNIINDINLHIRDGSFNCILGPNGSGKTTLIKNIVRLLEPEKESIYISKKDIIDYSRKELSQNLALVPQTSFIEYEFTVEDIVMMGRMPYQKRFSSETAEDVKIVESAMIDTDVFYFKDRSINNLSGGERQRVIIARALAQKPKILILDEPISYLDIHHQVEIMKLIKKLSVENNITVIMILHDINFAIEYAENILFLKDGKIYASGTSDEVITSEIIKSVYGVNACIIKNPISGYKYVIPY